MNKEEIKMEYNRAKALLRKYRTLEEAGYSLEICEEHTWRTIHNIMNLKHRDFQDAKELIEGITVQQICAVCGVKKDIKYSATKGEEMITDFDFKEIRGGEE
tara:strand:+ start:510 stop:815 length:306 start_codon:yes stop_codon:yes gene_type:complete